MITDDELWEKCVQGILITSADIGLNQKLSNCSIFIYAGEKTFYTDGSNYFDKDGNEISRESVERIIYE